LLIWKEHRFNHGGILITSQSAAIISMAVHLGACQHVQPVRDTPTRTCLYCTGDIICTVRIYTALEPECVQEKDDVGLPAMRKLFTRKVIQGA
jgi:hypothetical protein